MNEESTTQYDQKTAVAGLSGKGKTRALAISCREKERSSKELAELGSSLMRAEPALFWVCVDSSRAKNPFEWCSQFARSLRTAQAVTPMELAKFALQVGKALSPFRGLKAENQEAANNGKGNVSNHLVENFEKLLEKANTPSTPPKVVLALQTFDEYSDEMLAWLSSELNQSFRESKAFNGCRFVFAMSEQSERTEKFFNDFGFENVHRNTILGEERQAPIQEKTGPGLAKPRQAEDSDASSQADADLSKSLLSEDSSTNLVNVDTLETSMDATEVKRFCSSYDSVERSFLKFASYPTRVSRFTLEHFTSDREAALCFNWLKRHPSLCAPHPSGDLVMLEDARAAGRALDFSENPEQAKARSVLASVLDAFHQKFPDHDYHWIPINLQLFESFDSKILNSLFSHDEILQISQLLEVSSDEFVVEEACKSLSPDAKLVTRRYMELSEKAPLPGLADRVRQLWLKDQATFITRKSKVEEEKGNISAEIEGTLNQITALEAMKKTMLDEFRKPKSRRAEKVYSFSSSKALIALGMGTMGASLLSESIGAYHAACGLALTFFGFFWPMVDVKRAPVTADGPRSNLAIETQQRSLSHRISSLGNRVKVMKGNLDNVERQLEKLGESPPAPYLEFDETRDN